MEDGSPIPVWGLLILFLLFILNGILYGFAAGVLQLNDSEVEKKALSGDKASVQILALTGKPFQYLNLLPIMHTIFVLCYGILIAPRMAKLLGCYVSISLSWAIVFVVSIFFMVCFGILPFRRVGTFRAERFCYRYVFVVYGLAQVFYPVTVVFGWTGKLLASVFGVDLSEIQDSMTEEEIISMVDEAHEQGVIQENEAEMIQNIISFNETDAQDVMTHRKNVIAFELNSLLHEIIDRMMEEGYSRYPVYEESLDNIVGIIHYKDALKFMMKNSWARFKPLKELPGLIRDAALVPETRGIGDMFHGMQSKKIHMAVVVDEYGQTCGIVSMEDILEEIVGEILDEYDDDEIKIRTQTDNSLVIDGLAGLQDVAEKLSVDFENADFETLNGYLTALLGHIPTEKDMDQDIVSGGYRFRIISLGNKTIDKVRVEKMN